MTREALDASGLIAFACNRIFYALEADRHTRARDETGDAADALRYAGQISPVRYSAELFRLSILLKQTLLASIGHPSAETLEAVRDAAELILSSMAKVAA